MNDSTAEGISAPASSASSSDAASFAKLLGVGVETAETLLQAGYSTAEAVRELSVPALERLGITSADIERIRGEGPVPSGASQTTVDHDRIVERWVGTVHKSERPRRRHVSVPSKDSTDTLRKWVDGDDSAMEEWIHSSEAARPAPSPSAGSLGVPETVAPARPRSVDAVAAPVVEREETVVRWLTGLLDRVKSDQFDPTSLIQEAQDLQRQLYDERTKRKQLEEEVEHVKRGSIAVIKYVRSHEAKEKEIAVRSKDDEIAELKLRLLALEGAVARPADAESSSRGAPVAPVAYAADAVERAARDLESRLRQEFSDREHDYIERETDLRRRAVQLESEVRNVRAELDRAQERGEMLKGDHAPIPAEVDQRLKEVDQRERDLVTRENELRSRFEEIRIRAEEIERRRAPIEVKERELVTAEQQLQTRREALDAEARRLEDLRHEPGRGVVEMSEVNRLDSLRRELQAKESALRGRETALEVRAQELDRIAASVATAEGGAEKAEPTPAAAEIRVKSGIRRLDDLLYGGFPIGAQVLINGPAHTGKDALARLFSIEGLKLGIPSIWVVTDSTWAQVRDDLIGLYPGYADADKNGMVRYVDMYSRSVGAPQAATGVRMLSSTDKGVLDQLAQTVNGFSEELKEKFPTYRLIFESVSTVTAYLDATATFRFLQPFIGRRKLDQAVAYYVLDRGMHSDADLETLEHMVDGSINLKVEQLKTFLAVKGIGETQSRAWIGYTFTKRSLNLGSFSLDHIR